jgi:thiol-disulfide isomerase/thioredoxin
MGVQTSAYDRDFYAAQSDGSRRSADVIVPLVGGVVGYFSIKSDDLRRANRVVSGTDYEGNATVIDPSADGPTMIVLLTHWCPHCNAEVPRLNEWRDCGEAPDGLNIVGVSTGVRPDAPNFAPNQWLVDKDWQWPVLADDENGTAMAAYGGTSYPTMVLVDGNGDVFRRVSGEVPIDEIDQLVDQPVVSSTPVTTWVTHSTHAARVITPPTPPARRDGR